MVALAEGCPYIYIADSAQVELRASESEPVAAQSYHGLVGVLDDTVVPEGCYVVHDGAVQMAGEDVMVAAQHAYIDMQQVPDYEGTAAEARAMGYTVWSMLDSEDAIRTTKAEVCDAPSYDLSGRRIAPQRRGLLIRNGRLILRK